MSDTKDDILEAATKLFLQRSYDAVSIKDITEAVGVTKGALYHHFSSKEELFSEVIGREFHAYQIDFGRLPKHSFHAFYRAVLFQTHLGCHASSRWIQQKRGEVLRLRTDCMV